jgi:hypothetical protein
MYIRRNRNAVSPRGYQFKKKTLTHQCGLKQNRATIFPRDIWPTVGLALPMPDVLFWCFLFFFQKKNNKKPRNEY